MSNQPTGPEDPIAHLVADGYDMVLESGHLVVRRLPYLAPSGLRKDGRLVLPVNNTGGTITDASGDHRIWFAGEDPRDERGAALGSAQPHGFSSLETAGFMMSFKPPTGSYSSLHEKIRHYAHILRDAARQIDPDVTDTPGGALQEVPDDLPLVYPDTNTTRAGLTTLNNIFRGHTIAIVGVGGTGSYILDQVAKTWVDQHHSHRRRRIRDPQCIPRARRSRARGRAGEAQQGRVLRRAVLADAHRASPRTPSPLTADNLHLLGGATFVFLAAADADARPEIMQWLHDQGVPFIDVGMSFREGEGGLTGVAKVAAYLPGDRGRRCRSGAGHPARAGRLLAATSRSLSSTPSTRSSR